MAQGHRFAISALLTFGTVPNSPTAILERYSRGMLLLSPVLSVYRHLQTTNEMNYWRPIMRLISWVYWSGLVYNISNTIEHRYGALRLRYVGWNVPFSSTSGFEHFVHPLVLSLSQVRLHLFYLFSITFSFSFQSIRSSRNAMGDLTNHDRPRTFAHCMDSRYRPRRLNIYQRCLP